MRTDFSDTNFRLRQLHKTQRRRRHWTFALARRALLHCHGGFNESMTGPSPASHCHCHCRCHVIGQVIARGKECIQFVFESTTAYLRNCLLKEANFQEIPKITFFQCPKVAPLFTPHMGMYPMLLYFIQNLRVHTFTT